MSLACATGCTQHRQHLDGCPCADPQHEHAEPTTATYQGPAEEAPGWSCHWCSGCLPRLAAHRRAVCPACERVARDGLAELPDLWVDLAERPRLAGITKALTSEGDTPDLMSDARRQERSAIKAMLVSWCLTLADDYAITIPDEATVAATTRRLAAWHSDQARQARDAANLLDMPTEGPLHRDQIGAAAMRRQAAESADHARGVRDDRETGRDILRAICEHITRHAGRLLAGEHAEQLVSDVKGACSGARGLVYASRGAAVRVRCDCGEHVPLDTSSSVAVTACRTCHATGTLDEWRDRHQSIPDGPRTLAVLKDWLLGQYARDVPLETLRTWSKRTHPESGAALLTDMGRDDKGRRLFDPLEVEALSRKMTSRRAANAA